MPWLSRVPIIGAFLIGGELLLRACFAAFIPDRLARWRDKYSCSIDPHSNSAHIKLSAASHLFHSIESLRRRAVAISTTQSVDGRTYVNDVQVKVYTCGKRYKSFSLSRSKTFFSTGCTSTVYCPTGLLPSRSITAASSSHGSYIDCVTCSSSGQWLPGYPIDQPHHLCGCEISVANLKALSLSLRQSWQRHSRRHSRC